MKTMNGSSFLAAVRLAFASLSEHNEELNKLNVFPVPDGDTGLNMSRTLAPVLRLEEEANLGLAAQKASEEILKSSRGNSGTILATFFLGFALAVQNKEEVDSAGLIEAFKRGTEESYHSIAEPTEGTILTVMKDASSTLPQESIEATLEAMEEKAYVSLQNTPNLMPLLKKAGVVDAGGLGFCYVVESFHESILGKKMDVSASLEELSGTPKQDDDDLLWRYCCEGVLKKNEAYQGSSSAHALEEQLAGMGGSLVYVETPSLIKFHVHVNDDKPVHDAVGRFGTLLDYKVEDMQRQVDEKKELDETPLALIPVITGEGFAAIYQNFEIPQRPITPMGHEASYEEFSAAIAEVKAKNIVLLPNNGNAIPTCELLVKRDGDVLHYLPSHDEAEGIIALSHFDPTLSNEENLEVMGKALQNSLTFRLAKAEKAFHGDDVKVTPGDYVILKHNEPLASAKSELSICSKLIKLLEGYPEITVYYGVLVKEKDAERLVKHLKVALGHETDIMLLEGGQALYPYIITGEKA